MVLLGINFYTQTRRTLIYLGINTSYMDLKKELRIMVKYILPEEEHQEDVIENYVDTLALINEEYVMSLGVGESLNSKVSGTSKQWANISRRYKKRRRYIRLKQKFIMWFTGLFLAIPLQVFFNCSCILLHIDSSQSA